MPLDAVAIGGIAHELNRMLVGSRVDRVQQPERDEVVLHFNCVKGVQKLVISANSSNARIHLTDETKENPFSPPMFCMLLRKHISGGRVQSIKRLSFERVVDIELLCRNELGDNVTRHLFCEIMGRNSNIIFTDENLRIFDSVKHIDLTVSAKRNILPGLSYFLPPDSNRLNPLDSSAEDYTALLKNSPEGREACRIITEGVMGISPLLAAECVYRACGDGNILIGELSEECKEKTAIELYSMFQKAINNAFAPCVLYDSVKKTVTDFSPFEIRQHSDGIYLKEVDSINTAASEFYLGRDIQTRMNDRSAAILKVITNNMKRAEKKLNILQTELKVSENRDMLRIYGDLITANISRIKKGDEKLLAVNFYSENAEKTEITLDKKLSPSQNAAKYYTKYKKAKNTEKFATEQIEATVQEINYLESVLYSLSNASTPSQLAEIRSELVTAGYIKKEESKKKKTSRETAGKPLEFEYEGYTIIVGRNNVQNDEITLKMSRSRDLWLHTKNIPGSHTLVKYTGEPFPDKVIEVAASIAAYYSKAKNSLYAEVDYCPVSHVKKPSGAKAGMVIYEGYKTALVKPDGDLAEKLRK